MPITNAHVSIMQQDTSLVQNQQLQTHKQDSSIGIKLPKKQLSPWQMDSLLRIAEKKREEFKKQQTKKVKVWKPKKEIDTMALKAYDADTIELFRTGKEGMVIEPNSGVFEVVDVKPVNEKFQFTEVHTDSLSKSEKLIIPNTMGNKSNLTMDWMMVVFLLLFGFIAWARLFNVKYFNAILLAAVDYQTSFKLFRDKNAVLQRVSLALNILSVLSLALFFYFIIQVFANPPDEINGLILFSILAVAIGLQMLWKQLFSGILGFILLLSKEFLEYAHNVFIYYKILGIALLPVCLLLAYSGNDLEIYLLYVGIGVLLIALLMRLIRSFRVFMQKGVSIVYLILYFCSLEILPVILIVKAIKILV